MIEQYVKMPIPQGLAYIRKEVYNNNLQNHTNRVPHSFYYCISDFVIDSQTIVKCRQDLQTVVDAYVIAQSDPTLMRTLQKFNQIHDVITSVKGFL